jgi:hypothetical protein
VRLTTSHYKKIFAKSSREKTLEEAKAYLHGCGATDDDDDDA